MIDCQSQHGVGKGDQGRGGGGRPIGSPYQNDVTTPVPSGEVTGGGNKPYQPPGSLCETPGLGHNWDHVGGESNIPKMPQMLHVCLAEGSEWPAPLYRPFPPGRGAEAPTTSDIGCEGGGRNFSRCLRSPPRPCILLHIPWENPFSIGQWLAGGGAQPNMAAEEVGLDDAGAWERGSICPDVGCILGCGGTGGYFIWVGDVGYVLSPVNWEKLWRLPTHGVLQTDGAETVEGNGWDVGVSPTGRGDGGGRPARGWYLRLSPPEHSRTLHSYHVHYVPVSSSGATSGTRLYQQWGYQEVFYM